MSTPLGPNIVPIGVYDTSFPSLHLVLILWVQNLCASGPLFPSLSIGMLQNVPHHTVRLLPFLFIKDSIFVIPDSLEDQAFNVFPSSFIESLPSCSCLMRRKPFQTQLLLSPSSRAHEIQIPALPTVQGIDQFFVPAPTFT